jgi:hypothetical protein
MKAQSSFDQLLELADGRALQRGLKPQKFGLVDVRDVARLHVLAATTPAAAGRR